MDKPATDHRKAPFAGLRVVFMGCIGPAPYGTMLLADLGADGVRVDRLVRADDPPPNPDDPFPLPVDPRSWGQRSICLDAIFQTRTRDEWCRELEGAAACVSPVLAMSEAPRHPHHAARASFAAVDGVTVPAPGPRFSRTPAARPGSFTSVGAHSNQVRAEFSPVRTDVEGRA